MSGNHRSSSTKLTRAGPQVAGHEDGGYANIAICRMAPAAKKAWQVSNAATLNCSISKGNFSDSRAASSSSTMLSGNLPVGGRESPLPLARELLPRKSGRAFFLVSSLICYNCLQLSSGLYCDLEQCPPFLHESKQAVDCYCSYGFMISP